MGIDIPALDLLRYANTFGDFRDTVTIGRQNLNVAERNLRNIIPLKVGYKHDLYCESLLKSYFGSTTVESIDASNYENATFIHDMNKALPAELMQKYDTIIDSGTLEHIYNISQALENCSLLCRPGGQIIHILPTNNFCGHGFWQISPELFFSLYSDKHGYRDTEVFLTRTSTTKEFNWFKVKKPENGQRVNVFTSKEIYVLVRTVLKGRSFSHENTHQSDYVYVWNNNVQNTLTRSSRLRTYVKQHDHLANLASMLYEYYNSRNNKLSGSNPHLIKTDISNLLSR